VLVYRVKYLKQCIEVAAYALDSVAEKLYCHQPYILLSFEVTGDVSCLFGLAVECATTRLSTWTGLISWTELGTNPARGAKNRSDVYTIGLISWAASEGSTVSLLICDRWLTRKLATFIGSTNSLQC